jgi:hypothetical protein
MNNYKVDEGVEIPVVHRSRKWLDLVNEMNVADSIFFLDEDYMDKMCFIQALNRTENYKAVKRIEMSSQGQGYRVWKTIKSKRGIK